MGQPTRPPANGFVAVARKVYNPIGFAKGYNFVLFVIFDGAMLGFSLARMEYLSYYGNFCQDRGECYKFMTGANAVGFMLHLFCVIPAAFLVVFQFVPFIRHKFILLHRINGHLIIILSLVSTAGVFMIARDATGGGIETQLGFGFMAIIFLVSLGMAYINIKRLQIEQHRAWMLRAWFYAASIITLRIILVICLFINTSKGYYTARGCGQVDFELKGNRERVLTDYPDCAPFYSGDNPEQLVLVPADLTAGAPGFGSSFQLNFGAALWLALVIHAVGIEIYLKLTPAEAERLRNVSYQRQLEAGMKNPGRAGLTIDRFGDAVKWVPEAERGRAPRPAPSDKGSSPAKGLSPGDNEVPRGSPVRPRSAAGVEAPYPHLNQGQLSQY